MSTLWQRIVTVYSSLSVQGVWQEMGSNVLIGNKMTTKELAKICATCSNCDYCLYIPECNQYRKKLEKILETKLGGVLLAPSLLNVTIDKLVDLYHGDLE